MTSYYLLDKASLPADSDGGDGSGPGTGSFKETTGEIIDSVKDGIAGAVSGGKTAGSSNLSSNMSSSVSSSISSSTFSATSGNESSSMYSSDFSYDLPTDSETHSSSLLGAHKQRKGASYSILERARNYFLTYEEIKQQGFDDYRREVSSVMREKSGNAFGDTGRSSYGSHYFNSSQAPEDSRDPHKSMPGYLGKLAKYLYSTLAYLNIRNIALICNYMIRKNGAPATSFAIFSVINFAFPFFMSSDSTNSFGTADIILRIAAAFVAFTLLFKNIWNGRLNRYYGIYWYFSVTFSLTFYTTFLALENGLTSIWMVNIALATLVHISIMDSRSFLITLTFGVCSGCFVFEQTYGSIFLNIPATVESFGSLFYIISFALVCGFLFARNREMTTAQVNFILEDKITERTADLRESYNGLKRATENLSHEIRTPVQGIIGIVEPLLGIFDDMKKSDVKSYLKRINLNAMRLQKLVKSILDHTNLENGKLIVRKKRVDLVSFLDDFVLDKVVETKTSIKFETDLEKHIITTDTSLLERALANIIENSIKYAKGKDLRVTLEVAEVRVDKEGANETNNKISSNMTHDAEQYDGDSGHPTSMSNTYTPKKVKSDRNDRLSSTSEAYEDGGGNDLERNSYTQAKNAANKSFKSKGSEKLERIDTNINNRKNKTQANNQAENKTTRTIIKISDSGPGVAVGEEMKIFKPYFEGSNTKKNSGGTGIGLSIVWMIAKSLGANIKAYNKHTGKGLVIEIWV